MGVEPDPKQMNASSAEPRDEDIDAIVDEAAIESFPASDPPPWTTYARTSTLPPARVESSKELFDHLREDVDRLLCHRRALDGSAADRSANRAAAADYIARRFLQTGRALTRYPLAGSIGQNIEVEIRGESSQAEVVIVGAHVGAARCLSRGYDDVTGVAALLALARAFAGRRFARTVRLVAFADEAESLTFTPTMGSVHYADFLARAGTRVTAVMCVDAIGYFTSGARAASSLQRYPLRGDFVTLLANLRSRELARRAARTLASTVQRVDVHPLIVPGVAREVRWSDLHPFYRRGFSGFMVTDTGLLAARHHEAPNLAPRIDFDHLAEIVPALAATVASLSAPD